MSGRLLLAFFLSLYLALPTYAGVIKGRVTVQSSGESIPGATVRLTGSKSLGTITGLDGSFIIKDVPSGHYQLIVTSLSFTSATHDIQVSGDAHVIINIVLSPASDKQLHEVTVAGRSNTTAEQKARSMEKEALQVMNIVSAKAIALSPDMTVANVAQRISGVSIERNSNGDGQYAILRGMDKRYNYTLVNGVKIPSPDNKYRYVPLDIFPSELLDRLEVYKALTPSMEADAIGGAINMVMKTAPNGRSLLASLSSGYNELFMNRDFMSFEAGKVSKSSPYEKLGNTYNATPSDFAKVTATYSTKRPVPNLLGSFSAGDRFLHNKLGVLVAGSYQRTYRGSNSLFYDAEVVDTARGVSLTKMSQREYSERQERIGIHAVTDYKFNDRHKLQWYNAYMQLENVQVRDVKATVFNTGGYNPAKGNAALEYNTRSRLTSQHIFTSNLQGEHQLSNPLSLQWSAVYAKAGNREPDNTTIPLRGVRENFVERRTTIGNASRRWEHNTDRDLAAYLQLNYLQPIAGIPVEWKLGGLYRDKQRTNFYNNYQLLPANLTAEYGKDFQRYEDIQWTVQNPQGSVASGQTYDASEKISAGFLQFNLRASHLEVTGGARVENTRQGYVMRFKVGEDRPESEQTYTDVLPSLHVKYMPDQRTNLRASYFRSLNRPGFAEIIPTGIIREEYREKGDPDLKHATADNYDLRYEFFPRPSEQFMAGIFYKKIYNPIEFTLQPDKNRGQDIYLMPGNFGNATNYGLELDMIKYFRHFGIKANYTYTHSAITTAKSKRIRRTENNGDLETITVEQSRPLYGQSAHVGNLSLLYKDLAHGWEAQLAGNYTGERINTVSQFLDNDLWQKGFVQLDFSVEKTWGHITCFLKANNLLNTPLEVYIKNNPNNKDFIPEQARNGQTLIRRDYYQRTYLAGVRYKL
ncbi:outer membrane beta-barrel protein [Chitinophaga pendula]|uniref:TonB-dependent receptor n=1 Tax=Chitinophaga TaxID=79328 RepID=UPI000BB02B9D|nr:MULTISPECIES: TonB-dependent receptor [Chitinophaga]ASZ12984.1 TonB-dependent receptor [Chitinophaga sp. MD30]UCJ09383.1 outer membrane beta-barrel protein [Chitinophaga pendula]